MNRIEAINELLKGNTVRYTPSSGTEYPIVYRIIDKRVQVSGDFGSRDWGGAIASGHLKDDFGYDVVEEPKIADTIRLIINGKTYKAVRERTEGSQEE